MSTYFNNASAMGAYNTLTYGYSGANYHRPITAYTSSSSGTMAASTIYLFPISFDQWVTPSSVAIRCATLVASSSCRLMIYNTKANGMPSTLVSDLGTVSTATTGEKSIAYTTPLFGQYWIGLVTSAHTMGLSIATANANVPVMCLGVSSISASGPIYGIKQASASSYFSAAPADLSSDTWTIISTAADMPAIAVIV